MITILLTKMSNRLRWTAIGAIVLLLGAFITFTQYSYYKKTNTSQFSPFGGWQLASNALFAYAHVPPGKRVEVPAQYKQLQTMVDRHTDSLEQLSERPDAQLGIYYLWNECSPLKQNMYQVELKKKTVQPFGVWAQMGNSYNTYGSWLVKQYPMAFIQYYLWPNLINYYVPRPEFMASYNMGKDTIDQAGVDWFRLKTNKVNNNTRNSVINICDYYPIALALINLLFLLSLAGFSLLKGFSKSNKLRKKIYYLQLLIWLSNAVFSVLASPIVLRYQIFPMLITQSLMIVFMNYIIQESRQKSLQVQTLIQQKLI
ncbi:MAG TPA: hypothetical protein VNS58_18060 [Puia sp.]|nr:hypothetical protein [Puia sp.]